MKLRFVNFLLNEYWIMQCTADKTENISIVVWSLEDKTMF